MTEIIESVGKIHIGGTYRITGGFYKGEVYLVRWIARERFERMTSGTLVATNKVMNVPIKYLAPLIDRDTQIRNTAQKLLKAGKKEAALKLLKTIKK